MKGLFLISAIMLLLLVRCDKSNELKKSVMIPDPEFPNLPAYSDWGFNTFGAYYDREVFISNDDVVPGKVTSKDDTTSFLLQGQHGASEYYYVGGYKPMSMTFLVAGLSSVEYQDLLILNDSTFDLTNSSIRVLISIDAKDHSASILSGSLTFKKAQNLLVDKIQTEVILSGYFEFKALVDGQPVTVTNGRFDVGVGPDNFYKL